ncbi:hypothetical protein D3C80_2145300 [compost metagenome]
MLAAVALAANNFDFVDKNNGAAFAFFFRFGARLPKKVANSSGAYADIHLDKFAAGSRQVD